MKYAKAYIGGRGIAARIAWEELKPGIDAFDPENLLIFMTGPLTGSLAPSSGRIEVCGAAPQAYPKTHYTRSNMGGWFGPELKYAGFDGIVIQGASDKPVYLWIKDGEADILDAKEIWGLDTFETQKRIRREKGKKVKVACIGPAGENLVRIAVIHSEIENAAGQGGFGAVMGSKRLKAIAVQGTGGVRIARPKEFLEVCEHVRKIAYASGSGCEASRPHPTGERFFDRKACTLSCGSNCLQIHKTVKGEVVGLQCCSGSYMALEPAEEALEAALSANRYGLNHWEIVNGFRGRQGWLPKCRDANIFTDEDFGIPFEPLKAEFWIELLRRIAYREGIGDILAEGWVRASKRLGKGSENYVPHVAHGYQAHWNGHLYGAPRFPYWLVSALTWITDSRDPLVHGYASRITSLWSRFENPSTRKQMLEISRRVYGSEKAVDPESGYEWKAQPTIWNQNRDAVKDSLVICDVIYPLHFTPRTESGYGDTTVEARLFSSATGMDMDEASLDRLGERIFNLERAIAVREGRRREIDEELADYFRRPDYQGISMDWERFRSLLSEYYELRGWNVETGIPTKGKLEELGLEDVAKELHGVYS
jgi:aldehyde:ferredoxin oxidoreductase